LTDPERFVLQDEAAYACTVTVCARQNTGEDHAFFKRMALVQRTGGTVALVGSVQTIGTDINPGSLGGVSLGADDVNKSLKVQVTGAASHSIAWLVHIEALELRYAD